MGSSGNYLFNAPTFFFFSVSLTQSYLFLLSLSCHVCCDIFCHATDATWKFILLCLEFFLFACKCPVNNMTAWIGMFLRGSRMHDSSSVVFPSRQRISDGKVYNATQNSMFSSQYASDNWHHHEILRLLRFNQQHLKRIQPLDPPVTGGGRPQFCPAASSNAFNSIFI